MQAGDTFEQLVAWHREDLDRRLTAAPLDDSATEGYRFYLDKRPVAQIEFTAEGSHEDTGWFLWPIDTTAFEASPDELSRWLGDPWPVDVPASTSTSSSPWPTRRTGRRCARRPRPSRSARAPRRFTPPGRSYSATFASDLAKGASPFQRSPQTAS